MPVPIGSLPPTCWWRTAANHRHHRHYRHRTYHWWLFPLEHARTLVTIGDDSPVRGDDALLHNRHRSVPPSCPVQYSTLVTMGDDARLADRHHEPGHHH